MSRRREPPEGYTYVDALAPILRTTKEHMQQRAAAGMYRTAKQWTYTTVNTHADDGYKRGNTYTHWIITWEEYLEILQSVATKQPEFYISSSVVLGPFESQEAAEAVEHRFGIDLARIVPLDSLQSYSPQIIKEN